MQIDRRLLQNFDWALLSIATLIPVLGLIVLYSAGYDPDATQNIFGFIPLFAPSPAFVKQIVYLFVGLGIACGSVLIPPQKLAKGAYFIYGFFV